MNVDVVEDCSIGGEVSAHFGLGTMCEAQKSTALAGKPFVIDGMDGFGLHCFEATLIYFLFNDKFCVFCNLVQLVDFHGTDDGRERARVFRSMVQVVLSTIMPMYLWSQPP